MTIRSRGIDRCEACALTRELCLCAEIEPVATQTRVVLVVHHVELRKTTNTGRLVHAALPNSELHVRGLEGRPVSLDLRGPACVLYPSEQATELTPSSEPMTLIIPDGNWNQARRIVRREAALAGLPHVYVRPGPTAYTLRRNPREGTVSTLEACAEALAILEGGPIAPLMALFRAFVERSHVIRTRGKAQARPFPAGESAPRDLRSTSRALSGSVQDRCTLPTEPQPPTGSTPELR